MTDFAVLVFNIFYSRKKFDIVCDADILA